MPLPIVVVELAPPDAPAELSSALVDACSRAVAHGRCALVTRETEDTSPYAIAIVSWQGVEQLRVRIEVGIRRSERSQWLSRSMSFRAEDDKAERWKAAGLTIATLVGEVVTTASSAELDSASPRSPAPPSASRERPKPPGSTGEADMQERSAWLVLDGATRVGPGLESGSLRVGAVVAAGYHTARLPLAPWVSATYSTQVGSADTVAATWLSVGAGASWNALSAGNVGWRLRTELQMQRLAVSATDYLGDATESGTAWNAAWLVGSDVLWPEDGKVALAAGLDAWTTTGHVAVRVHRREVGVDPVFNFAGRLGIEVRWP